MTVASSQDKVIIIIRITSTIRLIVEIRIGIRIEIRIEIRVGILTQMLLPKPLVRDPEVDREPWHRQQHLLQSQMQIRTLIMVAQAEPGVGVPAPDLRPFKVSARKVMLLLLL